MIAAFTGTRGVVTQAQSETLAGEMRHPGLRDDDPSPVIFLHGGAEGADELAHLLVLKSSLR